MRKAIVTEKGPKPIGPYSQAVVEGDFIFLPGRRIGASLSGKKNEISLDNCLRIRTNRLGRLLGHNGVSHDVLFNRFQR